MGEWDTQGTTPPFQPGQIPGLGSSAGVPVPGIPSHPQGQTGATPGVDPQKILAALLQASQRKQMANTAVPSPVPSQGDPQAARLIGMGTGNPHAWGTQRFLGGIAENIKTAVAKQKEKQLLQAEGDWTYLQSSLNELYAAQQSGDPNAVKQAQAKVDATLGDPKKLKNMAKALNQDWLNPEKTTVYGEALKKVTAKQKQQDQTQQQKQTAAQKLKETFMKVLGQKQQLQLTAEQQRKMIDEIQKKAPTTTTGLDKEAALALREEMKAEERAAEDEHKAMLKREEDDRKEAAKQKEMELKAQQEKEITEVKEKFAAQQRESENLFREKQEHLREVHSEHMQSVRDEAMMDRLTKSLDAKDRAAAMKEFKTDSKGMEKEYNDSVTSLKSQLAQEQQNLRSIKTASTGSVMKWMTGPGKQDIQEQQDRVDNYKKAIEYLEKSRDDVVKGKKQMSDVVDKAYEIMGGSGSDAPPAPPSGFVPDKKPG